MNPLYAILLALPLPIQAQHHHWAPLIVTEAEEVDIDTATMVTASTFRRAWLRWTFDRAARRMFLVSPPYRIELVEINCVTLESRVLAATEINAGIDTSLSKEPKPTGTSEAAWRMPATGSLFGQVNAAACHREKPGA